MASLPRIMVVDHQSDISRVVRSTLDLLNYPAIVVDVPSSNEALLELQSVPFAVLVTAYNMPGLNGIELAKRAVEDVPDIECIVLAETGDSLPEEEVPFALLVRPMAATQFVKTLQRALGEEVVEETGAEADRAGITLPPLGPVPKVDLEGLGDLLNNALINVGAMAAVLMDRDGNILVEHGAVGYLDRDKLTETFAAPFAALTHIAGVVGGRKPSALYLWDGKDFDIYALSAGLHHFVCLVFESTGGKQAALGPVTRWGRRAVDDMVELIGSVAFELTEAPAKPKAPRRRAAATRPTRSQQSTPAPAKPEPQSKPAAPEAEEESAVVERAPRKERPAPPPPTVEVDDNVIKAALNKMDDVDPDAFWESIGSDKGDLSGSTVGDDEDGLSFEEALQLGLLPPDLGGS